MDLILTEGYFGYDEYLSPFTWRYGSKEMRKLFSERGRRATWRRVWLSLAKAQAELGLLSPEELRGIEKVSGEEHVDVGKAHEIEREIRHDLMAELRVYAGQAGKAGGKLHLGATSMDIEDNAEIILFGKALDLVLSRLVSCLEAATDRVKRHRDMVCMGWTHLQPAEPTTLGYRFTNYAQDLVTDIELVESLKKQFLKGKGIKGAVGTSASFVKLLGSASRTKRLERSVMEDLGMPYFGASTQTYPRKVDYLLLSVLASIAQSASKFGLDLRVLQSPTFGELSEPIEEFQVGSSAMPFKKNPVTAERICSLGRVVSVLPLIAFMNAASTILERTLDDSASRRIAIPEAFLAVDECLRLYERLLRGLRVYPAMIRQNIEKFGMFAGTEAVMMRLVEKGADRQAVHELIRVQSFIAWEEVMKGKTNPLPRLLSENSAISTKLTKKEVQALLDPSTHIGNAREKCDEFVEHVARPILSRYAKGRTRRVSQGAGPEY